MISDWTRTKFCTAASNVSKLATATLMGGLRDLHHLWPCSLNPQWLEPCPCWSLGWQQFELWDGERRDMELNYPAPDPQWNQCHCVTWEFGWQPLKSAQEKPIPSAGQAGGDNAGKGGHGKCSVGFNFPSGSLGLALCCSMTYMSTEQTGAAQGILCTQISSRQWVFYGHPTPHAKGNSILLLSAGKLSPR